MKIYEGTPGTSIASPNFERGGRMPRLRFVLVEEVRERIDERRLGEFHVHAVAHLLRQIM